MDRSEDSSLSHENINKPRINTIHWHNSYPIPMKDDKDLVYIY